MHVLQMDKASIVGDAVLYVQELQMKAKKLKAEIAGLEASLAGSKRYDQGPTHESPKKTQVQQGNHLICKKIIQVYLVEIIQSFHILLWESTYKMFMCQCRWMCFKWRKESFM